MHGACIVCHITWLCGGPHVCVDRVRHWIFLKELDR